MVSGFADYQIGDTRKRKEASKCKAFGLSSWRTELLLRGMENLDSDVLSMRCHREWNSGMVLVGLRDRNWT